MGYGIFAVTCLGFAFFTNLGFYFLFFLYGLVFAFVDTTERAYISDLVSPEQRGFALGLFHGVIGVVSLAAGLIAGEALVGLVFAALAFKDIQVIRVFEHPSFLISILVLLLVALLLIVTPLKMPEGRMNQPLRVLWFSTITHSQLTC